MKTLFVEKYTNELGKLLEQSDFLFILGEERTGKSYNLLIPAIHSFVKKNELFTYICENSDLNNLDSLKNEVTFLALSNFTGEKVSMTIENIVRDSLSDKKSIILHKNEYENNNLSLYFELIKKIKIEQNLTMKIIHDSYLNDVSIANIYSYLDDFSFIVSINTYRLLCKFTNSFFEKKEVDAYFIMKNSLFTRNLWK